MYLLDTNICIFALNGRYSQLNQKLLSVHPDDICISAVTVSELAYGAAKSKWGERTRHKMLMFLANYEIIPFTQTDAVICGEIRGKLALSGTPIGAYDIMIASQGISRELIVVTNNTKEFRRIPNIKLEDWTLL